MMFPEYKEHLGSTALAGYKPVILNDLYHTDNGLGPVLRDMVIRLSGHSMWERRGLFILPNEYAENTPFAVSAALKKESPYETVDAFLQSNGFKKQEKFDLVGAVKSGEKPFPEGVSLTDKADVREFVPRIVQLYEGLFIHPNQCEPGEPSNLIVATSFMPKDNYQRASIWSKFV